MTRPDFYDSFQCIGGKCDFTCCQEWKIHVDKSTYKKWKNSNGKVDFKRVSKGNIKLNADKKCPFLREDGLCDIVHDYGDAMISETCQTFPREPHYYESHTEMTLMPCCPEVVDFLNNADSFRLTDYPKDLSKVGSSFELRDRMMGFMREHENAEHALLIIYYILLEQERVSHEKQNKASDTFFDSSLFSIAPELEDHLSHMKHSVYDTLNECNELLLDVIENYRSEGLYSRFLDSVSEEALSLEALLNISDNTGNTDPDPNISLELETFSEFRQGWLSNYGHLLKNLLTEEFYAELLTDPDDLQNISVKYQWIVMEYIVLRQFSYLTCRRNHSELTYKQMRDLIVLTSRIMGYEDDDIYEYLSNSFETLIWEWGYMALLIY